MGFALARARAALEQAGLDTSVPLEAAASSVTNDVWLSADHVVRVNRRPHSRLRREAELAASLPAAVGYPEIVAHGSSFGSDWVVARRARGAPLAQCWPDMSGPDRRRAVRALAARLHALHTTPCPTTLPPLTTAPQLLDADRSAPAAPLLSALNGALALSHVDRGLLRDTIDVVRATSWVLEPFSRATLVHGDLTFENVLWDGTDVTAVLDLEWARGAPADLDLDVLLRFCADPYLHVADSYADRTRAEDYAPVPGWLAEDYPGLFAHPHLADRLRLYSIAYDVRDLVHDPPRASGIHLSPDHAQNRLTRTLSGRSHLDVTFVR